MKEKALQENTDIELKEKDNVLFQGAWYRAVKNLRKDDRLLCYDTFFQCFFEKKDPNSPFMLNPRRVSNPIIAAMIMPWLEQAEKEREAYFKACERRAEYIRKMKEKTKAADAEPSPKPD